MGWTGSNEVILLFCILLNKLNFCFLAADDILLIEWFVLRDNWVFLFDDFLIERLSLVLMVF